MTFTCFAVTLGREAGNGMAMLEVEATSSLEAEGIASRVASSRFGCDVEIVDVLAGPLCGATKARLAFEK